MKEVPARQWDGMAFISEEGSFSKKRESFIRRVMEGKQKQRQGQKAAARAEKPVLPAYYGLLIALAFVFSYIESMIPFSFGVPGVKLGLGNLVSVIALYTLGWQAAAAVSLVRVVLTGFTFGNMSMMMYGLAGAFLSLLIMMAARRLDLFGITGVSIAGGVAHNVGQIAVAAMVLENGAIFYYLPVLLVSGCAAGAVIGLIGGMIVKRVRPLYRKSSLKI